MRYGPSLAIVAVVSMRYGSLCAIGTARQNRCQEKSKIVIRKFGLWFAGDFKSFCHNETAGNGPRIDPN